jgi:two-component system cell cycle sensor histidine kinase/response regulator CckA
MRGALPTGLVAEDYEGLRYAMVSHLRLLGYQVIEAVDGLDALHKARNHPGSIEILVTDLMMPKLRGDALAHAIRRERPELRVLFLTAELEEIGINDLAPVSAYLRKPYDLSDVVIKLRELLTNVEATKANAKQVPSCIVVRDPERDA